MNTILNPKQSNTKPGAISLQASVDLTGKENYLLKIVNSSGTPKFALPTAVTDVAPYICMSGDSTTGDLTAAECPSTGENCRIKLTGTCVPGDRLALSSTYGTLYAPAASAGSILVEYIAEEAGVDGQDLLVRRVPPRLVTF